MTRDIMGNGAPPRTKTSPARDGAWLRGSVAGVTHEKTGVCGACFKRRPSETTTYTGGWEGVGARWSVSRVLSPPSRTVDDHSSGTRLAARLTRPTRAARRKNPCAGAERTNPPRSPAAPIRSCSRWGLPCRLRCRSRGALLPHPFTLACRLRRRTPALGRRFPFCGTFPGVAPAGRYPAPYFRGARTFLSPWDPMGSGHPATWRPGT